MVENLWREGIINSTFVLYIFNAIWTIKVYIISNDTCPPLYWYSGVRRRADQHVPPMLAGGGNFLIQNHLKIGW